MGAYIYKLTGNSSQNFTIYDGDTAASCGRITYSFKPGWGDEWEKTNDRICAGIERRWGDERPDFVVVKSNTSRKPKALDQVVRWGEGWETIVDDPNFQGREVGYLLPRFVDDLQPISEAAAAEAQAVLDVQHDGRKADWCDLFGAWIDAQKANDAELENALSAIMRKLDTRICNAIGIAARQDGFQIASYADASLWAKGKGLQL